MILTTLEEALNGWVLTTHIDGVRLVEVYERYLDAMDARKEREMKYVTKELKQYKAF